MKKVTPYLFGISAAGLTILLAGTVSYIVMPPGSQHIPELQVAPEVAHEMASAVLEAKCAACHGDKPDYNGFLNLLSGGLIKEDIESAQRAFTITPDPALRSVNVDYLKMDRVLNTRRMPPARYSTVHFGSRLTPEDVAVLRTRYSRQGALARMFRPIITQDTLHSTSPMVNVIKNGAEALGEDEAKIVLGHMLFFDPRLSTTNEVSCASCHDLTKGGTDNKAKSEGVPGADGKPQLGGVNAPSVYNAAGNILQFWDGRAANLQEQAGGPPLNPVEMGYSSPEDWKKIAGKLEQDAYMVDLFRHVYGDKGITGETITDAIATFEKCLVTPGSAFDEYLLGNVDALTDAQKKGMEAFGNYGCGTCHSGPNLGGISFEYVNTFAPLRGHAKGYKEGAFGREDCTKDAKHHDMFRVPTLRNVALTAPYFHTGTVDTLEDAVRIMFRTQVGTEPSGTMVKNITAFLNAQTGKLGGKELDRLTPEDVAPTVPAIPEQTEEAPAKAEPEHVVTVEEEEPVAPAAPAQEEKPAVLDLPKEIQPGADAIISRGKRKD